MRETERAGRAQQGIPFINIVLTFGEESTGVSGPLLEEKEVMAETESGCVCVEGC